VRGGSSPAGPTTKWSPAMLLEQLIHVWQQWAQSDDLGIRKPFAATLQRHFQLTEKEAQALVDKLPPSCKL